MGMFDELKDKAEEFKDKAVEVVKENAEMVEKVSDQVIDRGGDLVNKVTGGRFGDHIDEGKQAVDEHVGE